MNILFSDDEVPWCHMLFIIISGYFFTLMYCKATSSPYLTVKYNISEMNS